MSNVVSVVWNKTVIDKMRDKDIKTVIEVLCFLMVNLFPCKAKYSSRAIDSATDKTFLHQWNTYNSVFSLFYF